MNTTSVNTERANGIAIYLQRLFASKKLEERQFIGGQHHVLHILMDEEQMKQHIAQYQISVHPGTC